MKRSKKITIGIITFFVVITVVIIGRYSLGLYFKKKFSKRPPPGVVVEIVQNKNMIKIKSQIDENIIKNKFIILDARSKNRFLGLEPEPRPGIKSGSIEGSKSLPLSELVNSTDNTFLSNEKLKDIFDKTGISGNKIVMSCGSSVSASSLALAYSLINDDYMAKIYVGSWTEYGKE